jgi:hypothetical protein
MMEGHGDHSLVWKLTRAEVWFHPARCRVLLRQKVPSSANSRFVSPAAWVLPTCPLPKVPVLYLVRTWEYRMPSRKARPGRMVENIADAKRRTRRHVGIGRRRWHPLRHLCVDPKSLDSGKRGSVRQ